MTHGRKECRNLVPQMGRWEESSDPPSTVKHVLCRPTCRRPRTQSALSGGDRLFPIDNVTVRNNAGAFFLAEGGDVAKEKGSRTSGREGHPVCTSEARGARKIGEGPCRSTKSILDAVEDSPPD